MITATNAIHYECELHTTMILNILSLLYLCTTRTRTRTCIVSHTFDLETWDGCIHILHFSKCFNQNNDDVHWRVPYWLIWIIYNVVLWSVIDSTQEGHTAIATVWMIRSLELLTVHRMKTENSKEPIQHSHDASNKRNKSSRKQPSSSGIKSQKSHLPSLLSIHPSIQ